MKKIIRFNSRKKSVCLSTLFVVAQFLLQSNLLGQCNFPANAYKEKKEWLPAEKTFGNVTIQGNNCSFDLATTGKSKDRIYRKFPTSLPAAGWKVNVDLKTETLVFGPAHMLLGLTAGTLDPDCSIKNQTYVDNDQDAIRLTWETHVVKNVTTADLVIQCKDGLVWKEKLYSGIVISDFRKVYYISLERLTEVDGRLSVYSDAKRTKLITTSFCFEIPATVKDLNTIQHGAMLRKAGEFKLTAKLSNLAITCFTPITKLYPEVAFYNSDLCAGNSITLSALKPGISYSWFASDTGRVALATGMKYTTPALTKRTKYFLESTSGCVKSLRVIVPVNIIPVPELAIEGALSLCSGASTQLTVSCANSYYWDPIAEFTGSTSSVLRLNPTVTTTFKVTGTAANGCVAVKNITLTVNPTPAPPTISGAHNLCGAGDLTLTAAGSIGNYRWLSPSNLPDQTSPTITVNVKESTGFLVMASTEFCQSFPTRVWVNVSPVPDAPIVANESVCGHGSVTLTAFGPVFSKWYETPTGGSAELSPNRIYTPDLYATKNYYVASVSSDGLCESTTRTKVTVEVFPTPVVPVVQDVFVCEGTPASLTASGSPSGYRWYSQDGVLVGQNSILELNNIMGDEFYSVTSYTGLNCESAISHAAARVLPTPIIDIAEIAPVCSGFNVDISANGADTYTWSDSPENYFANIATYLALVDRTYTVTGKNMEGCSAEKEFSIKVNPTPILTITGDTAICAGGSTTLTASGAYAYSWGPEKPGNSNWGTSATFSVVRNSTFTLSGISEVGCFASKDFDITVKSAPELITTPSSATICAGESIVLSATLADSVASKKQESEDYISSCYLKIRKRAATTNELEYWSSVLIASNDRNAVALQLLHSDESFSAFIEQSYIQLLGRSSDARERAFWINEMQGGLSREQLIINICVSDEFFALSGSTVEGFVDRCFLKLQNRTKDSNYWIDQINAGVTKEATVFEFLKSEEYLRKFVRKQYLELLNRLPAITEENIFTTQMLNGLSQDDFIKEVLISDEFFNQANQWRYTWSPALNLNTTSGPLVTASPTENTIYTVTMRGSEGCESTAEVSIVMGEGPAIIVSQTPVNNPSTSGVGFVKVSSGMDNERTVYTGTDAAAWGDYDNDGDLDFLLNVAGGGNEVYKNNCGVFEKIFTIPGMALNSKWVDCNQDGYIDIVLSNQNVSVYYNNKGTGNFGGGASILAPENAQFRSVALADYNNDGTLDMAASNNGGLQSLLYNNGGGFNAIAVNPFSSTTQLASVFKWGDYDNDGYQDLFLTIRNDTSELYHNNKNGTFTRMESKVIALEQTSDYFPTWVDYDNDGDLDLYIANSFRKPISLFYSNNGNGTFSKSSNGLNEATDDQGGSHWADFDNDGDLDVLLANVNGQQNFFYLNDGGNFSKVNNHDLILPDNMESPTARVADYNNDGFSDVFIGVERDNGKFSNYLYKNTGNGNHSIKIKCIGQSSNVSAIGARVSITSTIQGTIVTQMREITDEQDGLALFGTEQAATVDVKVYWPKSKITQHFSNVTTDQVITITEGEQKYAFREYEPYGRDVELTASGASMYSWSPALGLNTTFGNTVIASTSGVYAIEANSGKCNSTTTVTVNIGCAPTASYKTMASESDLNESEQLLSEEEQIDLFKIDLYPNPTSGLITIDYQTKNNFNLIVTDLLGKDVFKTILDASKNQTTLDLSGLPMGYYNVGGINNERIFNQKVILQQ